MGILQKCFRRSNEPIPSTELTRVLEELKSLRELVKTTSESKAADDDQKTVCQKEIDEVFERIGSDQSEYDKQLLTLSSAFLGVGLAFIKDVVPLNTAIHLCILYAAFVFLTICIFAVLFSYQFSILGQFKAKKYWEEKMGGNTAAKFPYNFASVVKCVNIGTGLLFAVGVALLATFVILNMSKGAQMQPKPTMSVAASSGNQIEKGQQLKTPPAPSTQNPPNPDQTQNSGSNNTPKKP